MSKYTGVQQEHQLKNLVFDDYFGSNRFRWEQELDNIDFIITNPHTCGDSFVDAGGGASEHCLWAEAKKGTHNEFDMFTQLILTCRKTYDKGEHLAPPWIACFDETRIAFVPFHEVLPIFSEVDFNWTAPSRYKTQDFQKAREKVKKLIGAKIIVYNFGTDDQEIKDFIKIHFAATNSASIKIPITKDNFVQIFIKWVKEVKPFINIPKSEWEELKERDILDGDFYRADIMSCDGTTITEKLKIVIGNDKYKFQEFMNGRFTADIDFTDGGEAYKRFWNKYGRPPSEEYQQYIIDRRDVLVPQNIRELKGSFFTPKVWADKSKEYLAEVFGKDWQENYYVWDCAAGTGNLLAGLTNKYNVWASDIEQGNVETMQALIDIDEQLNLLPAHVFQFDFLNDGFDKLPSELKKIIDDPEKRTRLIMYINPPYAEVSSMGLKGKAGINQSKTHDKYKCLLGAAGREVFVLFLARIYFEITGCKIGEFSKMKVLNGAAFDNFRDLFKAKLEKCFIIPANTFDNVTGQFPIGFKIWNTEHTERFERISVAIFDAHSRFVGNKTFFKKGKHQFINKWISLFRPAEMAEAIKSRYIGFLMGTNGNGFQHNNIVYICNRKEQASNPRGIWITEKNLFEIGIYFLVRHCFEHTWLNDVDQFLYPHDDYINDIEFHNNCLIFTLFHGQNRISCRHGVNHWIPFTEKEVGAKEKFDSNCMSDFLSGKTFSLEAQAVLCAGKKLWQYYHAKTKADRTVSVNASYYDIREYFQGRRFRQGANDKGIMNSKSTDETYNHLLEALKHTLRTLAQKIQAKVYLYGFLKE